MFSDSLSPLAFRDMSAAALNVYREYERKAPKKVIDTMQTRAELYDFLDYHAFKKNGTSAFRIHKAENE